MVKNNEDKETAFRVRNLKDQIKRNNEEFIRQQEIQQQQQQQQQANTQHKNASGGNINAGANSSSGANKHFYSNDPNAYKPREHFSDYFQKKNIEFDIKNGEKVNLNVSEFYKGFARFNSYAWGIAASIGLACFVSYKLVKKVSEVSISSKNNNNKEQEQKQ